MDKLGAVLKSARPRSVAALRRFCGDLERAEDAFQDAGEQALIRWPDSGLPDNPTGWLIQTGKRKIIDWARRDRFQLPLETDPVHDEESLTHTQLNDDLLRLIFTCCHPALSEDAQIALTLKVIAGLSTEDVALAFLTTTRTMEQRLARARSKLRTAGIPFKIPADHELQERLHAVLATVYLMFNQGYSARRQSLSEPRLCVEAIWLSRLLLQLFPGHPEVSGLLALQQFHHARIASRQSADGRLIPLAKQDRSLWDQRMITEASTILEHVLGKQRPGPYQTQAAIAALHCQAATADWAQIAALYEILEKQTSNPVIRINRAVAMGESGEPEHGLELLDSISEMASLVNYAPLYLAQSRLLQLVHSPEAAAEALRQALLLTTNPEQKAFLEAEHADLLKRNSE